MTLKLAVLTAASAFLSIGTVTAAEPPEKKPVASPAAAAEQTVANPASGFGSSTGMGPGGGTGSASSPAGGFGSPVSGSGAGSQTFGGGFNSQQTPGSGPLSVKPSPGPGTAGGPTGAKP